MAKQDLIVRIFLFLVTFTLPMFMGLNNVILGVFLVFVIVNGLRNQGFPKLSLFKSYCPVFLFFILALIAAINNTETFFLKHLESYWSFLLIPISFGFLADKKVILLNQAFKGLVFGCAATLIFCYANAIYEIITYDEPWSYFLRWRHLSHYFTEIADTHPAYLGLFICTSTFYLLFINNTFSNKLKILLLALYALGLLQLSSRVALLIFSITFVIFIISKISTLKKHIGFLLVIFGVICVLFFSFGSDYLKDRIFSFQSIEKDDRFDRFMISFEVFKEHPILGIGFEKIEETRVKKYTDHGYIVAAHYKYNAHNQLVEYLSINGILGAIIYLGVLLFLIVKAIKQKDYMFLFIILSFFIANMTESMLVRIKGIEYFSLFITLFLTENNNQFYNSNKRNRI